VVLENNAADTLFSKEYATVDNAVLNFDNVRFAVAGKFTTDNVSDIAFCYDNPTGTTQSIYVLQSTKNSFLPAVDYYTGTKQQLAFADITSLVSSTLDNSQKVSATLWKNNKRGAVTFGFDDGYVNAFRYGANYLAQQKLRGTFYDISNLGFDNDADYANWDTLSYYNKQGHEICSHTANHKGIGAYTDADSILLVDNLLQKSKSDLDNILQQNTISLSYPFGNFNYQSLTEVGKYFYNARSSQNGFNLATPFDFMALRSKFVSSTTLPSEIDTWLSRAETYQYHLSIMFHNMSNVPFDKSADEYIYGFDDFKQSVTYAQQRSLWIDTQGKVYKYIKERNELKIVKYETASDTLSIKASSGLDTTLFNEELTLKIELPATWNTDSATIADSGKRWKLPVQTENNKLYTYVNSIPDNRELKLWQTKYLVTGANTNAAGSAYVLSTFRNANQTYLNIKGTIEQGMHVDAYDMLGQKILSTGNIIETMPANNYETARNSLVIFILSSKNGSRLATCKATITN
jgi:peptidoglycan/xylan/chitin deacetylase (PgdA/CDA1 family)